MTDHPDSHDPLEDELRPTLQRLAGRAPADVVVGGRELVERRVRRRAERRRRAVGVGVAASVVALVGGVYALRSDPGTRVRLGAPSTSTSDPGPGVVTGYSSGSVTGSPRGWTTTDGVDPASLTLPKVTASLDATWTPASISALTSNRGSGTAASPMTVLADGSTFVVVSVQPSTTLQSGRGRATTIDGRPAVIVRQSGDEEQLTVDVDATHRALVSAHGVDPVVLEALVATLHQDQGGWSMTPAAGSTLKAVATTPETSVESRSVAWERAMPTAPGATTSSPDPVVSAKAEHLTESITVGVQNGGTYEYYGQLAQNLGWSHLLPISASSLHVSGVQFVSAAAIGDGSYAEVIGLDAQGVVYTISHSGSPSESSASTGVDLALVQPTDAQWSETVLAAVASMQRTQVARAGLDGGATPTGSAAGVPATTAPPVGSATTTTVPGH